MFRIISLASSFTSCATATKPLPASPARDAGSLLLHGSGDGGRNIVHLINHIGQFGDPCLANLNVR
jgi:hypothetical protein